MTKHSFCANYLATIHALEQIVDEKAHIEHATQNLTQPASTAMVKALLTGVIRNYETLSTWVGKQTKFKPKDRCLKMLLMTGVFQYHYMDTGKTSETIYQAAQATVQLNRAWAKPIVYAVLKKAQKAQIEPQTNMPGWLARKLKKAYGNTTLKEINNIWQTPPTIHCARVNEGPKAREAYVNSLKEKGIKAWASPLCSLGVYVEGIAPNELPGLKEGLIYIQDSIHQFAIQQMPTLPPGARVLDACAAPGGKTTAMLCYQPTVEVQAIECNPKRFERLKENLSNYKQATAHLGDARHPSDWWNGKEFDAIILDVPCSATGLIQKKPEIKLIQTTENIKQLKQKQQDLIQAVWPLLKRQGLLLYSTCSILPEENEEIIQTLIERGVAERVAAPELKQGQQTHLPNNVHTGGFCAIMRKTSHDIFTELSTQRQPKAKRGKTCG